MSSIRSIAPALAGTLALAACGSYRSPLMRADPTQALVEPAGAATVVFVRPAAATWNDAAPHTEDAAGLGVRITDGWGRWLADVDPRSWVAVHVAPGEQSLGALPLRMVGRTPTDPNADDAVFVDLVAGRVYFVLVRALEADVGLTETRPVVTLSAVTPHSSAWTSLPRWLAETKRREPRVGVMPPPPDPAAIAADKVRLAALQAQGAIDHWIAPGDGVPDAAFAAGVTDESLPPSAGVTVGNPAVLENNGRALEHGLVLMDFGVGLGTDVAPVRSWGLSGMSFRLDADFRILPRAGLRLATRAAFSGLSYASSADAFGLMSGTAGLAWFAHLGRGWWIAPEATAGVGTVSMSASTRTGAHWAASADLSLVYATQRLVLRFIPLSIDEVGGPYGHPVLQGQFAGGVVF